VPHEFIGNTAEPKAARWAATVGGHHDQISALGSDVFQDAVDGQAIRESGGDRHRCCRLQPLHDSIQVCPFVFLEYGILRWIEGQPTASRLLEPVEHMDSHNFQVSTGPICDVQGQWQRLFRKL
jgi:hypothetical protein